MCQRAGDDSAVFPAGPDPCRVGPDLWVAVPEPVPAIDQRAAELQAALPADPAVPAVAGGLVLHWGQAGRPVQLRGPGHQRVGSPTPHHKKPPASPPHPGALVNVRNGLASTITASSSWAWVICSSRSASNTTSPLIAESIWNCTVGKLSSGRIDRLNGDLQVLGHFGTDGRTANVVVQGGPDGLVSRVVGNRTDRQVVRQRSHSRAA